MKIDDLLLHLIEIKKDHGNIDVDVIDLLHKHLKENKSNQENKYRKLYTKEIKKVNKLCEEVLDLEELNKKLVDTLNEQTKGIENGM